MSSEWIKLKQRHWPNGSLKRFLSNDESGSVIEALKKRIKEKEEKVTDFDEAFMNDLAQALAWGIIRDATRKGYRKRDSLLASKPGHSRVQDQDDSEL